MSRWMKKNVAIWATVFMVLAGWAVMAPAAAEEGPAEGRIAQPAPQWKVNDYFRYAYQGRQNNFQWGVDFGGGVTGTCDFTGTADHYEHYAVTSTSDPTWFMVSMTGETWQNGTYIFRPQGYNPSTQGTFKLYDKSVSVTPMKFRKTDLAFGDYTSQTTYTREYTWTNYGKWTNTTQGTQNDANSGTGGVFGYYKFPMDFNLIWPISGSQITHTTGQSVSEPDDHGQTHTTTFDYTDTSTYTAATGATGATFEPQDTQAGTFTDCYRIRLSGTFDFSETGTVTQDNIPQNINFNQPGGYFDTTRWYSNTAGNIVNYNSSQPTNGLRLSAYHYIAVPPNFKPAIQTLAGQQYAPNLAAIVVREGEPTPIEFTVLDDDTGDTLNWSVLTIVGATTNPQGAQLMDGTPQFATPSPTDGDFNHIHSNKLMITARQPKTVDRDEYTVTVNVQDGKEGGSLNFTFKLKVQNVNNKPYLSTPIPDIWMRENSSMTCTTWKMTDIFKDQDRDAGIVDPLFFTAVVTSGPWVEIRTDNDTGIVTFNVPDYSLDQTPMASWDSTIKFTVTDSGSGSPASKASNNTNARLHIEHVNHDPGLSPVGSDLAENGLSWNEDTVDTRLDLTKAFFDPDVKYADDSLTFSFTGQKNIAVKNSQGRITLTPDRDWNGKEIIKFKAVDRALRAKELRIDCNVLPVPDMPQFCETEMEVTWENLEALTMNEANSPTGTPNRLLLAITVKDPDGVTDTHQCMWYVNDSQGNTVYKSPRFSLNDDDYEFRAQFTGGFSASGSPYEVKVVVKDSFGLVANYVWNLTVLNTNRPPTIPRIDSPMDKKSFDKGRKIYFDAWNASDLDEAKENLTFIWNSSKQGPFKQDRGQAGAQFVFNKLKVGTHIITVTVLDSDGGEASMTFTVKIKEPTTTPGFEGLALVASIAVVVAVLGYRRRK